ncbi:hypothetical protein BDR07DRAFT_1378334 [Suillus spraguei]|nr:hypothetical protein BDR07DRAFT_1383055 [Suillus spraguei]KAG2359916.1 hypothetical protein BDR07DRAFT_1378334 [Suillus spraguei]
MQPSGQLPLPTNDDVYHNHFFDGTNVTVDFDGTFNDQYATALRTEDGYHDHPDGLMMQHRPPSELGFGQSQLMLHNDSNSEPTLAFDNGFQNHWSFHRDLGPGDHLDPPPSTTSMPPQPLLPHGSSNMYPNPQSHSHPHSHVMAPASGGAVHNHNQFQPDSEAGLMYPQGNLSARLESTIAVAAPVIATSNYHYSTLGPPGHLFRVPDHLGSFFQGYNQPLLTKNEDALLPSGSKEYPPRKEIYDAEDTASSSQDASRNQRDVKKRTPVTFHQYQWPPPKKARRVQKGSDLQSQKVTDYTVNKLSLPTGMDKEQVVQYQLENSATAEYSQGKSMLQL